MMKMLRPKTVLKESDSEEPNFDSIEATPCNIKICLLILKSNLLTKILFFNTVSYCDLSTIIYLYSLMIAS